MSDNEETMEQYVASIFHGRLRSEFIPHDLNIAKTLVEENEGYWDCDNVFNQGPNPAIEISAVELVGKIHRKLLTMGTYPLVEIANLVLNDTIYFDKNTKKFMDTSEDSKDNP